MRVTQEQRILEWLETGEPITQYDALRELGCMRLASRISDLKRDGYPVKVRTKTVKNRYGEKVSIAEYYMEESDEH